MMKSSSSLVRRDALITSPDKIREKQMSMVKKIYNTTPKQIVDSLKRKLGRTEEGGLSPRETRMKLKHLKQELLKRFERYNTHNLKDIDANDFKAFIDSEIDHIDSDIEDYSPEELDRQRDLSVKFHWGHNHDFGDFSIKGRMGNRHINVFANFLSYFPITIESFEDKQVFDIGCWTGGTTLLLDSLGANVFAIEEVKKYSRMVEFLIKSFGLEESSTVRPLSLYSCNSDEFKNRFDIVSFPGVIYHLSDPVLALRILYNSLRTDGIVLIESAGINVDDSLCRFEGPLFRLDRSRIIGGGKKENLNRGGWNWFLPSPSALSRMMKEAGFDHIQTNWDYRRGRLYGYGKKSTQIGICKAGLSVQDID